MTKAAKAILARLQGAHPVPLYPAELARSAGVSVEKATSLLDDLADSGFVKAASYKLAEDEPA